MTPSVRFRSLLFQNKSAAAQRLTSSAHFFLLDQSEGRSLSRLITRECPSSQLEYFNMAAVAH